MDKIIGEGRCIWDFYLEGEAVIIDEDNIPSIEACRGHIIVTHIPSPDIVLYMRDACAVIAETGGVLCHAAVLALEIGCPIIVAAEGVKKKIKNGGHIILEGKGGRGLIYEKFI